MRGKAFKFGDNITTDAIISGRYKFAIQDKNELAQHLMEDIAPEFYGKILKAREKGKAFIVGGRNFGIGSSREQAPVAIKYAGINAVIAKSFARIFYRNSFNIGLPLIECDTDKIDEGDELELSLDKGVLRNLTKGEELNINPIPPFMQKLLDAGGIVPYFKEHPEMWGS